jgi:hypothetical protein
MSLSLKSPKNQTKLSPFKALCKPVAPKHTPTHPLSLDQTKDTPANRFCEELYATGFQQTKSTG